MIKELMSWKSSDNAISLSAIEQASLLFIRNINQPKLSGESGSGTLFHSATKQRAQDDLDWNFLLPKTLSLNS